MKPAKGEFSAFDYFHNATLEPIKNTLKMKIKTTLLTLFAVILAFAGKAQQTGSFNTQISFNGQNRLLANHVPTGYDSTQAFRLMICLHGLGDNATNYRNALINSLQWQNTFPNTIFICPDGGPDQGKDFYAPVGDEAIIDSAIQFAMENYWIDSSFVVLQGFSLGGRSAVKFGLENPSKFKGLLLNTPAFQGSEDVKNNPNASLVYNFANAPQIPMYITVGDQDQIYYYILENTAIEKLKKHGGIVSYNPVAGMPHTIPPSSITAPAYPFFENPTSQAMDVDAFDIEMPQHTCDANVSPTVHVQNRSDSTLTDLEISYDLGGTTGTHTWAGSLQAFEHAAIQIPSIMGANGKQGLNISISGINGGQADTMTANNSLSDTIRIDSQGMMPSLSEGFEGNADDWTFVETGSIFEWFLDTDVKRSGSASIANFNTILLFYTKGNVESFESPALDLSKANSTELVFDVAYNYHQYTANVLGIDTAFTDTLEVAISTDCGQSWESLYKKGGQELMTASGPIMNPVQLAQCFFNPDSTEWRTDTIDLSAYSAETEAIIRFNYISANGGSINIDNILIEGMGIGTEDFLVRRPEVYPNPATDHITISAGGEKITAVRIVDLSGKTVFSEAKNSISDEEIRIETGSLPTGIYQVQMDSDVKIYSQKLLITD